MLGRDGSDPLFLQIKEAQASVLEPFLGKSTFAKHGQRVVEGQRLTQAASDIMLGWITVSGLDGVSRDFYIRQLWDGKGSALVELMEPQTMRVYAEICGQTLAKAHARSGDAIAIGELLGGGDSFDRALASFAETYADQNERDYDALKNAAAATQVAVETGFSSVANRPGTTKAARGAACPILIGRWVEEAGSERLRVARRRSSPPRQEAGYHREMLLRPLRRAPMMLGGVGFQAGLDEARRKQLEAQRQAAVPAPQATGGAQARRRRAAQGPEGAPRRRRSLAGGVPDGEAQAAGRLSEEATPWRSDPSNSSSSASTGPTSAARCSPSSSACARATSSASSTCWSFTRAPTASSGACTIPTSPPRPTAPAPSSAR